MASEKLQKLTEDVEKLSVLELAEWVKDLKEKFGVSDMPVMAQSVGLGAQTTAQPAQEEKSTFTVVLANAGVNKIAVIKEVRAVTNLGLKEAKDLVDGAPKAVKEAVSKEEAEEIKKKLETAGAKVELK